MTPFQLLQNARKDGVELTIKAGVLNIFASAQKREKWGPILRPYKADLLALIEQETATKTNRAARVFEHLETPKPSQCAISEKPANAPTWRAVRNAYYDHHARCPVCIAAGKGYGLRCGTGASLWSAYQHLNRPAKARSNWTTNRGGQ